MFKLITLVFLVANSMAAPVQQFPTEQESQAELKSAGMTQPSIDGLTEFTHRFVSGFPLVQANKEKTDKFIADYKNDVDNFINAMPAGDQTIYNNYLKKYGLAK